MRILGLDPATLYGWAHSSGLSGTWDLSPQKDESSSMRLVRLRTKLNEISRSLGVDLLVYEAARNLTVDSHRALIVQSELQGVLKVWCEDLGIPARGLSPSEIKKFATGSGSANKEKVMEAAKVKWPHLWDRPKNELPDDNEIDARWAVELAIHFYEVPIQCPTCSGRGKGKFGACLDCEGKGEMIDERFADIQRH